MKDCSCAQVVEAPSVRLRFKHKRKGFTCEREVRVLKYDEARYFALSSVLSGNTAAASPGELPKHRFLDGSLTRAIDPITVSPYASEAYESQARHAIAVVDLVLVGLSVLSGRRYPANF